MAYKDLSINEKINFKGLVMAWSNITVERFQAQLDKKVYARRRTGKRRSLVRTMKLRNDWRKKMDPDPANGGVRGIQLSFMLYGRFDDMGVGGKTGNDFALARYQRKRSNMERAARKPSRWYSREKGHQVHRLRELLTKYYVNITLSSLEQVLTQSVTVHI